MELKKHKDKYAEYIYYMKNRKEVRHGLYRVWYSSNGQIACKHNYKEGKLHGLCRDWYVNGQIKYERNYKDGKCHRLNRIWYEDGQIRCEHNYKDGKAHGLCRNWHDNGQIKYENNYINGIEEEEYMMSKGW